MKRRRFLTVAAVAPAGLIGTAVAAPRWSLEEAQIAVNYVCALMNPRTGPSNSAPQLVSWLAAGVRQSGHLSEIDRMEWVAAYLDGHPHAQVSQEHLAAVLGDWRAA